MKSLRGWFCLLFLLIVSSVSAALPVSVRWAGMGYSGLALSDTEDAFTVNPAALFRMAPTLFSIDVGYMDSYAHPDTDAFEVLPLFNEPVNQFDFTFATPFSALSVALDYSLEERESDPAQNRVSYTAYNNSLIRLNLAYGNDILAVGAYAQGGSTLYRPVVLDQENVLLDYISQVYFSRYYPSGMQQTFSTGAGLLVTYPYFSFGVLTDSLFGYDNETNEITYDLQAMVDELSVGFAFSSEKYDSDVQLSRYVVTTSFDFTDIGDEEHRAIRFGGELKVQFLNDLFIAIQAGYSERRPLPDPYFGFDWDGIATFGLGARLQDVLFSSAFQVPALWFSSTSGDQRMEVVMTLTYMF